jgi:flagellar motility protein MotE (MotC chaperone)
MRDARDDLIAQNRADLEALAAQLEQQIETAKELIAKSAEHLTKVRQHLAELDRQAASKADSED